MNEYIKYQWVYAIQSNEYEIINESLHNENGFSVIGILCDLFIKSGENTVNAKWINKVDYHIFSDNFENCFSEMPSSVSNWANLMPHENFFQEISKFSDFILDKNQIASYINRKG